MVLEKQEKRKIGPNNGGGKNTREQRETSWPLFRSQPLIANLSWKASMAKKISSYHKRGLELFDQARIEIPRTIDERVVVLSRGWGISRVFRKESNETETQQNKGGGS